MNNLARRGRGARPASDVVSAVFSAPGLFTIAETIPTQRLRGRPSAHPPHAILALGILARYYGSAARAEAELGDDLVWARARRAANNAAAALAPDLAPLGPKPPMWEHWRYLRDQHLTGDEGMRDACTAFTQAGLATARRLGLLNPNGPGSWNTPQPERLVYGDGTIVRPMYRPPASIADGNGQRLYPDKSTGELHDTPQGRHDPDALRHVGHSGPVHGTNYVFMHARLRSQRIVLGVAAVPAPGQEAETAVRLFSDVHTAAGPGILALVYDGALRGTHIDRIQRRLGVLVVNKLPIAPGGGQRSYPLGTWEHDTPTGPCAHNLATIGGRVTELVLDVTGVAQSMPLARTQVRRRRRSQGYYRFDAAWWVTCRHGGFEAWISPNGSTGTSDPRRAEHVRVLPVSEDSTLKLYGIRSDAESFNAGLKRALPWQRAASIGWRRGLIDMICFASLANALAEDTQPSANSAWL